MKVQKTYPNRNDLCPCGSGKKFKKCCIDNPKFSAPTNQLKKKTNAIFEPDGFPIELTVEKLKKLIVSQEIESTEELQKLIKDKSPEEIEFLANELCLDELSSLEKQIDSSNLSEAMTFVFEAWEQALPKKRAKLAWKALQVSPDCADAFLILAEDHAQTANERGSFLKLAIAAGENALGKDFIENNKGHFWGLIETRPYMRALQLYAQFLWQSSNESSSKLNEALTLYHRLIEMNPNDNQGVRYELFSALLEKQDHGSIENLLKSYPEESSALWSFNLALFYFQKFGPNSEKTKNQLSRAQKQNKFVMDYFHNPHILPDEIPDAYASGSREEAVIYFFENLAPWTKTPGALDWIRGPLNQNPKLNHQPLKLV